MFPQQDGELTKSACISDAEAAMSPEGVSGSSTASKSTGLGIIDFAASTAIGITNAAKGADSGNQAQSGEARVPETVTAYVINTVTGAYEDTDVNMDVKDDDISNPSNNQEIKATLNQASEHLNGFDSTIKQGGIAASSTTGTMTVTSEAKRKAAHTDNVNGNVNVAANNMPVGNANDSAGGGDEEAIGSNAGPVVKKAKTTGPSTTATAGQSARVMRAARASSSSRKKRNHINKKIAAAGTASASASASADDGAGTGAGTGVSVVTGTSEAEGEAEGTAAPIVGNAPIAQSRPVTHRTNWSKNAKLYRKLFHCIMTLAREKNVVVDVDIVNQAKAFQSNIDTHTAIIEHCCLSGPSSEASASFGGNSANGDSGGNGQDGANDQGSANVRGENHNSHDDGYSASGNDQAAGNGEASSSKSASEAINIGNNKNNNDQGDAIGRDSGGENSGTTVTAATFRSILTSSPTLAADTAAVTNVALADDDNEWTWSVYQCRVVFGAFVFVLETSPHGLRLGSKHHERLSSMMCPATVNSIRNELIALHETGKYLQMWKRAGMTCLPKNLIDKHVSYYGQTFPPDVDTLLPA